MTTPVFQDNVTSVEQVFLNTVAKTVYEGLGAKATPAEIVTFLGLSSTQIQVIDNLLSTLQGAALSANQGRLLKHLVDSKVDSSALTGLQHTSEKGQPSGYVPLDPQGQVDPHYLPPTSSAPHHIFASQADMLAGGAHITAGERILVHGDPAADNNGEYIALQDHPTLISHYDHLGEHIAAHRHDGTQVDVTIAGHSETLNAGLTQMNQHLATALQQDGSVDAKGVPFVSLNSIQIAALKANSIYEDDRQRLMFKDNNDVSHEVVTGDIAISDVIGLPAQVAAISTNTGKINTNTGKINTNATGVTAAKAVGARAESAIHAHTANMTDAHPIEAISGAADIFKSRLTGYTSTGNLYLYQGDLNNAVTNMDNIISSFANANVPAMGNYGLLSVRAGAHSGISFVFQEVYGANKQVYRRTKLNNAWGEWRDHSNGGVSTVALSQSAYDAITTKSSNTLYLIV